MRTTRSFAVPALLLVLTTACARSRLPAEAVYKGFRFQQAVIRTPQGLQVIVQEDHNSSLVVVGAAYRVGSRQDPAGREGLAHLVEHLSFRSRLAGRRLSDRLNREGATFNATTASEVTTYYAVAHRDHTAALLAIELARLSSPLEGLTEEAFQTERAVVRNELRESGERATRQRLLDEALVRLFPGHPLGKRLATSDVSLSAATLDGARQFVTRHYHPDRCVIIVAGDVRVAEVERMLAGWPGPQDSGAGGATPPPPVAAAPLPSPTDWALARLGGGATRHLLVAWSAPPSHDAVAGVVAVRAAALLARLRWSSAGEGIESAQPQLLRFSDATVLMVDAVLSAEADPARAADGIEQAMLDVVLGGRTAARSVTQLVAEQILLGSGDPVTNALGVLQYFVTTGRSNRYQQTMNDFKAVGPTEVTRFVEGYLAPERAVTVLMEPAVGEAPPAADSTGRDEAASADDLSLDGGEAIDLAGMNADSVRRVAHAPGVASLPRFKLTNGLEGVIITRPDWSVAEARVQLPGGRTTTAPVGLAATIDGMSIPCDVLDGDRLVENRRVNTMGDYASWLHVRVPAGNVAFALNLAAEEVGCRRMSRGWQDSLRRAAEASRKRRSGQTTTADASRAFWAALYPGALTGRVDLDALAGVGDDQVTAFLQSHYQPAGAQLVVVSDSGPDEVRRLAEGFFSGWKARGPHQERLAPSPPPPGPRVVRLVDRPGTSQAELWVGCRLTDATADTLPAHDLVEAMAEDEAFTLRDVWGATYGVHATAEERPDGAAHLVFRGAVETARAGASLDRLLGVLAAMGAKGGEVKTFFRKRWDLARAYDLRFSTGPALASAIERARLHGWPEDLWDRYPGLLAELSFSSVKAVMGPCVGHEVITVLGDARLLRPQLESRNLRPATR